MHGVTIGTFQTVPDTEAMSMTGMTTTTPTPTDDRYLLPSQVADLLQVTPRTVVREAESGRLRAVRFRSRWRIPESALAEYLEKSA